MNIQLVLSHYLAGLRERNELDALLPELLRAMGHSVLSRPQVGANQAGVDIVSTHTNATGDKEVFLYVVKFGDLGREDFYGGKQAVDPSVREASNDFIRNRLPQPLKGLKKRIVLVTNGTLKQEAQAGYAALSHDVAERPLCSLELWAADQLTSLIEEHLFDETLLLDKGKSDLRAALAALDESETSIRRFVRFAEACFAVNEPGAKLSKMALKRNFLKRCAAAAMGWAVLLVWGQGEGNLKPGVVRRVFAPKNVVGGRQVWLHRRQGVPGKDGDDGRLICPLADDLLRQGITAVAQQKSIVRIPPGACALCRAHLRRAWSIGNSADALAAVP